LKPPAPILAHAEETIVGLTIDGDSVRKVGWLIEGKNADKDAQRILRLEACPWCLETYPAPLKPEYERVWKRKLREMRRADGSRPWPSIPEDRLLMMVRYQQCPTCKKPVSERVAEFEYLGADPWAPGGTIHKSRIENILDAELKPGGVVDDPTPRDPEADRIAADKLKQIKKRGIRD
jgi:hypothetical protein